MIKIERSSLPDQPEPQPNIEKNASHQIHEIKDEKTTKQIWSQRRRVWQRCREIPEDRNEQEVTEETENFLADQVSVAFVALLFKNLVRKSRS